MMNNEREEAMDEEVTGGKVGSGEGMIRVETKELECKDGVFRVDPSLHTESTLHVESRLYKVKNGLPNSRE
ncbi:hypothetical protein SLEP1_g59584 [Rubroshorea leprosula]|uniref:Uncharacterized protein n=1 Tax=Rubroshorea leprosula TaxID=152421 RepID=A0AAV5MTW7_9ROSI|nr:hypothetical protein SLEP1_g59584 [Rubroshorea leprosula]